jgi:hypothetical protein
VAQLLGQAPVVGPGSLSFPPGLRSLAVAAVAGGGDGMLSGEAEAVQCSLHGLLGQVPPGWVAGGGRQLELEPAGAGLGVGDRKAGAPAWRPDPS